MLSVTFYPGWRAFVDGQEVPIYEADYLFRGVFLEQGQHLVEFRFRPWFLRIGLVLTLMVVGVLGVMAVYGMLGRRRAASAAQ